MKKNKVHRRIENCAYLLYFLGFASVIITLCWFDYKKYFFQQFYVAIFFFLAASVLLIINAVIFFTDDAEDLIIKQNITRKEYIAERKKYFDNHSTDLHTTPTKNYPAD